MIEDWVALFKRDYSVKVFEKPGKSDEVLYWVRRFENGEYHTAPSTGNRKALRSFELFDNDFKPCTLNYENEDKQVWECLELVETALDNWGSYCYCKVKDHFGITYKLRVHGKYGDSNSTIAQELYFTSLVVFLRLIVTYSNWQDLKIKNSVFFDSLLKSGVPLELFSAVNNRVIDQNAQFFVNDLSHILHNQ